MSEDKSLTIAVNNDQTLFQPIAYGLDDEQNGRKELMGTLKSRANSGGQQMVVAYPIDDAREVNNDQTLFQPIAFSHTQGLDAQPSEEVTPTLQMNGSGHAAAYDEYNNSIADTHHTLRAGTKQSTGVVTTVVRRLTPTECERLQGFPDGWTAQRLDHKTGQLVEQKDSARYKQMGNAVAVPCVQWLMGRIVTALRKE